MFKFWRRKSVETPADPAAVQPPAAAAEAAAADVPAPVARATPPALEAEPVEPSPLEGPDGSEAIARRSASWRERLAGSGIARSLGGLFRSHPKLDEALLDELETTLITADVGVGLSTDLTEALRKRVRAKEFADSAALLAALRAELLALLRPVERPLTWDSDTRPFVLLVVGVNGVGKTTTIGKLAQHLQREGARVMLAAGDTFRAAAVEQLKVWGERNRVPVVAQSTGSDAASVVFDALQSARSREIDVLIADTAGRLHNQAGLMDELAKVRRVITRLDPAAPHETLLVLDGTTGQNAISQVRLFREAAGVTGLAVTKLDGSAKGGVVFALAREFGLPIRFVGIGESLDDLRVFEAEAFVDGLLPSQIGNE
jgi:fused signal recognition particle receptor